jgi:hypothetical protein
VQCALGASRTRGTYLRNKYHKLKSRRGAKKAAVAIAHKILVSAYYILKEGVPYRELGENYLDKRNKERIIRYHRSQLERLGFEITVTEKMAA